MEPWTRVVEKWSDLRFKDKTDWLLIMDVRCKRRREVWDASKVFAIAFEE